MVKKGHFWSKPKINIIFINKYLMNFLMTQLSYYMYYQDLMRWTWGGVSIKSKDFVFNICTILSYSIIYRNLESMNDLTALAYIQCFVR